MKIPDLVFIFMTSIIKIQAIQALKENLFFLIPD